MSAIQLSTDANGRLVLSRPGQEDACGVTLRRAFPWSRPAQYVSVRGADGKELALIEDLGGLPDDQRALAERWLAAHCFVPRIVCIDEVDHSFGYQQWKVQTDRGPASFRVQEREDLRFLNDGRFTVKDADGNIYELPPMAELDERSRKALEFLI